jgi:hypothetical protein
MSKRLSDNIDCPVPSKKASVESLVSEANLVLSSDAIDSIDRVFVKSEVPVEFMTDSRASPDQTPSTLPAHRFT